MAGSFFSTTNLGIVVADVVASAMLSFFANYLLIILLEALL